MVKVAVIGYGYWGPNLARNFNETDGASLVAICDLKENRLKLAKNRYPSLNVTTNYKDIMKDTNVDAVAIATLVSTHYQIAKEALETGKHVLVEKPLTSTCDEAQQLIELSKMGGKVLMVDHPFVYTSAVRRMKEIVDAGELGETLYFDSIRVNLGLFQQDVNVIWDLAPHDISIIDYVLGKKPEALLATGSVHFSPDLEDIAYITIHYPGDLIAHINVSWLSPVKIRLTLIGGSKRMIVYDDTEPSEKIKVYDSGVEIIKDKETLYDIFVQYRTGDMYAPRLDTIEALRVEVQHFIECIRENKKPVTDGEAGLRTVRILEAAQESIKNDSKLVKL